MMGKRGRRGGRKGGPGGGAGGAAGGGGGGYTATEKNISIQVFKRFFHDNHAFSTVIDPEIFFYI